MPKKNEAILNLKEKQKEDNKKISKLQRELNARKAIQGDIYPRQSGPRPHADEGLIGKAKHLAGLTAEGVAAEMLTIMLIDLFLVLFQTEYRSQIMEFKLARKEGIAYEADPQTGK